MMREEKPTEGMLTEFRAEYRGQDMFGLIKGRGYAMQVEKMQIGQPIVAHVYIDSPAGGKWLELTYVDVAVYAKSWKKVQKKSLHPVTAMVT